MIANWFASGDIANVILMLMGLEAVALAGVRITTGRGIAISGLVANLLAGGCLILALKTALIGGSPETTALWLAGALVAHVADLVARWR